MRSVRERICSWDAVSEAPWLESFSHSCEAGRVEVAATTMSSVLVSEKGGPKDRVIYDWGSRKLRWAWLEGARHMLGIRVLSCRMKVKCRSSRSTVEAEHTEPHGRARGGMEEHVRWKSEASQQGA